MNKQDKVEKVMHEWKEGTLTSHGKVVTDYNQAIAIALSEASLSKDKYEGGGIGFIPMDLQDELHSISKRGGVKSEKDVIGILDAIIDSGLTDNDLETKPTRTATQYELVLDKKTSEIWTKAKANYEGDLKGNQYFSTLYEIIKRNNSNDNKIIKRYKPFRKFQYEGGGSVQGSLEILKNETNQYSINKYDEPIDEDSFMVLGYKKDGSDIRFDYIVAETTSGREFEVTPQDLFKVEKRDMRNRYEGGGEFEDGEDFIEDVKEMHEAIDYIVLKDGTRIDGKKLMEKGGSMYAVGGEVIKREYLTDFSDNEEFEGTEIQKDADEINDWIYSQKWSDDDGTLKNIRAKKVSDFEAKHNVYVGAYHTKNKYAVGGEIGNTVTFSRYGERTVGRVTDKLKNGYEVVTDEGTILVEPQEVISFSDEPIAKKKRFGFFEGGGEIEAKKQSILDFINQFPNNPKHWGEATDELPSIHKDLADEYNGKYDFDFEKRSSLQERNLRHKKGVKYLLNKLSDNDINIVYSKWEETLEDKFAEGGEIEAKIEKLRYVVNSKMLPEFAKEKARVEIEKLEKQLHESRKDKAEWDTENFEKQLNHYKNLLRNIDKPLYKAYNKKAVEEIISELEDKLQKSKETKSEEKSENELIVEKLYGILTKAEDLINYESGGIQSQSIDKIKKYVEYVNKEVSKLNVPFDSEIYDVLQDDNNHSLNLTLGLLGFYKNEKDNGDWARTRTSYKDLVNAVNEVKGVETEYKVGDPIKKITTKAKFKVGETVNFNNELYKILEIKKAKDLDGEGDATWRYLLDGYGDIMIQEDLLKEYKTPSKPTTRKAPVKKAVVKKVIIKKKAVKKEVETPSKPKADHKKLVAKLKAKKKSISDYSNEASLNTETGERRKRNEASDKKRSALPLGKRVSADGNVYYENRLNRGDFDKGNNFDKGGEVKGWGLDLNW